MKCKLHSRYHFSENGILHVDLSKRFVSRKIRIYKLLCRIKIIYSGMISWECSGMVTLFLLKRRKIETKTEKCFQFCASIATLSVDVPCLVFYL